MLERLDKGHRSYKRKKPIKLAEGQKPSQKVKKAREDCRRFQKIKDHCRWS